MTRLGRVHEALSLFSSFCCWFSFRRRSAASNMGLAGLSVVEEGKVPTRRPWCIDDQFVVEEEEVELVDVEDLGFLGLEDLSFFCFRSSCCCCCCCDVREFCVRVRTVNDIRRQAQQPAAVVGGQSVDSLKCVKAKKKKIGCQTHPEYAQLSSII